ncbi:hypothetical protein EV368DRAFT_71730 [Lentinula lateritia]|uniref:Uncharacterized protein n=1 Tax=Lentinula aff. lateritia TaxID=2804960 RepID=A0ACC1UDE3_9AGAR|nr:hypothetical protein F5876DRAFT_86134 [Lentinula aff. lateritia]KAJ3856329.1 hypothetical protein EV368DRAFT_71730 [Lentinula lateritia]
MSSGSSSSATNGLHPHPDVSDHINHVSHLNGFADPSPHNQKIIDYLYNYGFQRGEYADTVLHVHQNVYRLHAIILSRSPFLVQLLSTSPQVQAGVPRTIYVPVEREPEVTQEGFAIAVGYLYSSVSLRLIRPENARAVLAAGCMLGGMDDLCELAYATCKRSISVDTIGAWLEFVDAIPPSSSGVETPGPDLSPIRIYGPYVQRLRDDVFHFLVVTLPNILEIHATPSEGTPKTPENGREILLQVFSRIPFDMFKAAVESPNFQIGSDQARFKFAKEAIEARKRGIARGLEETVVLAFGGGNFGTSAVHVTRKTRKRPLWKVNS